MIARGTRLCTTLGLVVLITACGSDAPVPSVALATGSTSISAQVASSVAQVPSVRITDDRGRGVKDVLVRWRVTAGGGTVVNDSVRTARDGTASSGGWTLGTAAGAQTLEASANGVPAVTFVAQAAPGPVTQIVPVSLEPVKPVVNTVVSPAPAVKALDAFGNVVPGVPVTFAVVQGTGTVTGEQQVTNAEGRATIGAWRLGTTAGIQVLSASANGVSPTTIAVLAEPGAPANLVRITADLEGPSGFPVGSPPGVRVVDEFGNGVGGVPVTFTPGANSGSVTTATVISDPANGSAFVGSWTLGSSVTQTLTATSTQLPGRSVTFTATIVESLFNLDVRFVGSASTAVQTAFTEAARRWRRIIVGRLHDIPVNIAAGVCGEDWIPALNETLRDVVIYARVAPIDGPGSILGQAFICGVNLSNNMPALGVMLFDEADMAAMVADGSIGNVILHEMGHVLGIGTLWNGPRALLNGAGTSNPFFAGPVARQEFAAAYRGTFEGEAVPVENTGGAGTRDAHWRESVFDTELMTGFLDKPSAPLSRITIASLRDLGYVVNLSQGEAFTIGATSLYEFPFITRAQVELVNDVPKRPMVGFTSKGAMVKLLK